MTHGLPVIGRRPSGPPTARGAGFIETRGFFFPAISALRLFPCRRMTSPHYRGMVRNRP